MWWLGSYIRRHIRWSLLICFFSGAVLSGLLLHTINTLGADATDILVGLPGQVYQEALKLGAWLGAPLASLWLAVIALVIMRPAWLRKLYRRAASLGVEVPGLKLSVDNHALERSNVVHQLYTARRLLREQYEETYKDLAIEKAYQRFAREVENLLYREGQPLDFSEYRHCLFIPSYLDGDLIQINEYSGTEISDGKSGRIYSTRYGIIGRCFRLRELQINPRVLQNARSLVTTWGLTYAEAGHQAGSKRKSQPSALLAVPILHHGRTHPEKPDETPDPLGVVFLHISRGHIPQKLNALGANRSSAFNRLAGTDAYRELQIRLKTAQDRLVFNQKSLRQDGA